jgi:hypothetical protein
MGGASEDSQRCSGSEYARERASLGVLERL